MRARWWLSGWLIAGIVLAAVAPWNRLPAPQPVYAQGLSLGGFTGNAYDVNNFASVQAALDAIPAGSRLYFPSARGPYIPPDTSGWHIRKAVEIFSDGTSIGEDKGFQPYANSKHGTVFQLHGTMNRDFYLHDTVISSGTGAPGTGGVGDFIRNAAKDTTLARITIERVWMLYAGRSAIYLPGTGVTVGISIRNVNIFQCGGHGMFLANGHLIEINNSGANGCGGMGSVLLSCSSGIHIASSYFESNGAELDGTPDVTIPGDAGVNFNAQLLMNEVSSGAVMGNNFEDIAGSDSVNCKIGLTITACNGITVGGNEFSGTAIQGVTGIKITNTARGCAILSNTHANLDNAVVVNSTSEYGNSILAQNVQFGSNAYPGLVSVPAGSNNFAVITNQSLTGATNKVCAILLPTLDTNGNRPDSLTGTNGVYTSILQAGLLAFGGGDSLFIRRTTASGWKLVQ